MTALSALDNPLVGTVGWALIHFLWQGVFIWIGVALSLRLLRLAKPSTRYAVACVGLLLCIALPVVGVLRRAPPSIVGMESQPTHDLSLEETQVGNLLSAPSERVSLEQILETHLAFVVMAWAAGACLLTLRFASGLAWVWSLRQRETLPDGDIWESRLESLSRALGVERSVVLKVVRGIESPMAAGLWRPVIFIPMSILTGMPPELVEALLAHELAHIKRHDYMVNLLQSAIEVVLFYHPAVWWISKRIRIEREQICDDHAVRALGEPRRLALALQELDSLQLTNPHLAQAAHGGILMNRIRRLIHPEPRPLAWKAMVSIVCITAACVASAAISSSRSQGLPNVPTTSQIPPTPPEPPGPPKPLVPGRLGVAYAFVSRDGRITHSGSGIPLTELDALRKKYPGDFFWMREKGQSYVFDDLAEVAKLRELIKPMEKLGRQMDELGKQMDELGKQMGVLDKQVTALKRSLRLLEHGLKQPKLSTTEAQSLQRQQEDQEKQIHALEARMEALGKSMEARSEKMEAVGQRIKEKLQ